MNFQYNKNEQCYYLDQQYSFRFRPMLMHCLKVTENAGWIEKKHSHTYVEIIYVNSGSGAITVNDKTYNITKGDVIILNAGVSHFEMNTTDGKLKLICMAVGNFQIRGLPKNHLLPDDFDFVYHSNDMEVVLCMYFTNILSELERKESFYMEIATNAAQTLIMFIYRLISQYRDVSFATNRNTVVGNAQKFIEEHYLEDISLDDVARACKVSKSHLSHIFEEIKHVTIVNYIRRKRFQVSIELLTTTDLPIGEVAKQSGFPNANYFSRVFQSQYHISPRTYRKEWTQ